MRFNEIKIKLLRYNKMALFAKSIELITLTALTMLKDLFLQSKNSCLSLSSSLLQYKNDNYLKNSLLVPFFTDKNCIVIMNNRLSLYLKYKFNKNYYNKNLYNIKRYNFLFNNKYKRNNITYQRKFFKSNIKKNINNIFKNVLLKIKCFLYTESKLKHNLIYLLIVSSIRGLFYIRYGICFSGFGFDLSEVKPSTVMEHHLVNLFEETGVKGLTPNQHIERFLCGDGYGINYEGNNVDYSYELKGFTKNKEDINIPRINKLLVNRLIYCHTNETIFGYIKPSHGKIIKSIIEEFNDIFDHRIELFNRINSTENSTYFFNKFKAHFLKSYSNEIKGMNKENINKLIEDAFNNKLEKVSKLLESYKKTGNIIYRQNADYELLTFVDNKKSYENRIFDYDFHKGGKISSLDLKTVKFNNGFNKIKNEGVIRYSKLLFEHFKKFKK